VLQADNQSLEKMKVVPFRRYMPTFMRTRGRHLALGTISFVLCFAAWGMISAFAPRFREIFHLTASQTALLIAVPVLLGSLARIPMGILSDRFGGRSVFTVLMVISEHSRLRMDRSSKDRHSALCRAWSSKGMGNRSWPSAWNREGKFEPAASGPPTEPGLNGN
jgi:hypothetical protein